jgi:hypothetical protein
MLAKVCLLSNLRKNLLAMNGAEITERHFPHTPLETRLPDVLVGFPRRWTQLLIDILRQVDLLDKFGYRHCAFGAERAVVQRREDLQRERLHTRFSPILIAVRYV